MKRKDFTFTSDAYGYMIYYKGKPIGGASSDKTKKKHWRHAEKDRAEHARVAELTIQDAIRGDDRKDMREARERIDAKQSIVNVIEIPNSGELGNFEVHSYLDDEIGNKVAEAKFKELAIANGCDAEDIEFCLDNGFFDNNETLYYVAIVHST